MVKELEKKVTQNIKYNMARTPFKMKGYTYPGSPVEKDNKLVKTKGQGKNYDGKNQKITKSLSLKK